jgi:hypothetical protein
MTSPLLVVLELKPLFECVGVGNQQRVNHLRQISLSNRFKPIEHGEEGLRRHADVHVRQPDVCSIENIMNSR